MKAYISVSIKSRSLRDVEMEIIVQTLNEFSIAAFVFVDHYQFTSSQEREMMKCAMVEIDSCDFLIAEVSDKGIGVGVEVGYAKGKGKPVVYLRHQSAEHSTTVSGISDFEIIYSDIPMLKQKLTGVITNLNGSDSK